MNLVRKKFQPIWFHEDMVLRDLPLNRSSWLRKVKRQPFESLRENLKQFCLSTSMHGFKYLGQSNTFTEKAFWASALIAMLIISWWQSTTLFEHWYQGKIIVTSQSGKWNVWDVPFPAITICSESQLNVTRLKEMEGELGQQEYRQVEDYANLICDRNCLKTLAISKLNDNVLRLAFRELTLPCEETVLFENWLNDYVLSSRCQYFQPVVLETGLCYTMNMLPLEQLLQPEFAKRLRSYSKDSYFYNVTNKPNWTPATGYQTDRPIAPPWRVSGAGIFNSVKILLNAQPTDLTHLFNIQEGYGLKAKIHNPVDYPVISCPIYFRPNTMTRLMVTPQITTISDALRKWSPISRGCYYQHEKYLKFFAVYSEQNCWIECRANRTLKRCGCAAYYDPRTADTPVCGSLQKKCLLRIGSKDFSIFENDRTFGKENSFESSCVCLPSCTSVRYGVKVIEMKRNFSSLQQVDPAFPPRFKNLAYVEMYFKTQNVEELTGSPKLQFCAMIANIGGVISLCVGCSIISVFEVFHFFGLRHFFRGFSFSKKNVNKVVPARNNQITSAFVN